MIKKKNGRREVLWKGLDFRDENESSQVGAVYIYLLKLELE